MGIEIGITGVEGRNNMDSSRQIGQLEGSRARFKAGGAEDQVPIFEGHCPAGCWSNRRRNTGRNSSVECD